MLYNKYRPRRFEKVAGNQATKDDLQSRAKHDSFPSVMMFVGESGTGKTTLANIVAATINCHNPVETEHGVEPCGECKACLDVFDGRYNRDVRFYEGSDLGKESIEAVREEVQYEPQHDKKNVIIFDEAQSITSGGMERTLKLLETEKDDTHFILCTMNPKAFNKAIKSRGQVYNFGKLPMQTIAEYLMDIVDERDDADNLPEEFFEDGLVALAEFSQGSLRQAISDLERCFHSGLYTREDMERELGAVSEKKTFAVLQKLLEYDPKFFFDIREMDLKAFYAYSWKVLNETAMRSFNIEEEDPDDWKVKNSRRLLRMKGFWDLLDVFPRVEDSSGSYFNDNNFLTHMIQFYREHAQSDSPPKLTEKSDAPPKRRVRKKAS